MVGFCAVLPQPTGTANYCKRVSRLVILPDYQGLGVGTRFLDAICKMYVEQGYKMYIRSAHIKLAHYWANNACWRATARNGKKGEINGINHNEYSVNRPCYSYEYVGADFATKPHKDIIVDSLEDIDMDEMKKMLAHLKLDNYITIIHNMVKHESELNRLCKALGIRTELLYIHNKVSMKHIGESKLVSLRPGQQPVYRKVA